MIAMERELLFAEYNFTLRWHAGNIVSAYSYETSLKLYIMAYRTMLSTQNKILI